MNNKEDQSIHEFDLNLIFEYFSKLERQGPGSPEITLKALSFINGLNEKSKIADMGCGTGGQTILLAKNTPGKITGVDLCQNFIDQLNRKAQDENLGDRVKGIVGSMDNLPFENEEFDLIWSEGAIGSIGFEKGINYWNKFLKKGGYIAVTYESWFTNERPAEIEKWWVDAVPQITTVGQNVSIMQNAGYVPVALFAAPESCWTDNYYRPQKPRQEEFLKEHRGNKTAEDFISLMRREADLYSKYKQYYGYVFYIGKKI
ncbi:MAG: class I SAM-dependent methyltransferase [Bacteroidales bacterium]|jgi:SAM-dependent methyltransferase|nr:class I SAM-dependent methyltransferase [Bacteroidales bacterium]